MQQIFVHGLGRTNGSIGVEIGDNLFVGDALMNMLYPTVSMLYADEQEMLSSTEYISRLGTKTIYFGHGKPKQNRKNKLLHLVYIHFWNR